eukprot:TRINITY_DN9169_c0_g1_i1.p1 TRINITY_DN9169_c0_g1~~TRINITY_DN9169_c0_g1_i1.p1  ORF type:complete len:507 (+),score=110.11 TRINITY_DN9169_c0_g1_i1:56-1522(+)
MKLRRAFMNAAKRRSSAPDASAHFTPKRRSSLSSFAVPAADFDTDSEGTVSPRSPRSPMCPRYADEGELPRTRSGKARKPSMSGSSKGRPTRRPSAGPEPSRAASLPDALLCDRTVGASEFQPLLELITKNDFLCARVILSQIDDEDDRDMVSIRAFATVLSSSRILMQEFTAQLVNQELNSAATDLNVLFRDNCSPSTRFLDVILEGAKATMAECPMLRDHLDILIHDVNSMDMDMENAVASALPSLFPGLQSILLDEQVTTVCYILAELMRRRLSLNQTYCKRWALTTLCFLKVICPCIINIAMEVTDPIRRKLIIKVAKHLQSSANGLLAVNAEASGAQKAETDVHTMAFDKFASDIFKAGSIVCVLRATDEMSGSDSLTTTSDCTFTVSEHYKGTRGSEAQEVKNWKGFYRIVKRKLPSIQAELQRVAEGDPTAEPLIAELDEVKQLLEAARREEEQAKAAARAARTPKPKKKKPPRQGLYSVG